MRPCKHIEYSPKCLCPNLYNESLPLHWKNALGSGWITLLVLKVKSVKYPVCHPP